MRGALALAAAGLAAASPAFVLIDDFTVGEYHGRIDWPDNVDVSELTGLDRSHCVLGTRQTRLTVQTNHDRVPIFIDIGGGTSRVSYGSRNTATTVSTIVYGLDGETVDLSAETRIYCETVQEDPENRFADQWTIFLRDRAGGESQNSFFLTEVGRFYFRRGDFTGNVDWSNVNNIHFRQSFSPDIGRVPLAYSVNRIYAVPEPGLMALAPVLIAWFARRRRSAASHRR